MPDRQLLYTAAPLRVLATGYVGVQFGFHLPAAKLDASSIDVMVDCGLACIAAGVYLATLAADRIGYRRALMWLTLLGAGGAVSFAHGNFVRIAAAAPCVGRHRAFRNSKAAQELACA